MNHSSALPAFSFDYADQGFIGNQLNIISMNFILQSHLVLEPKLPVKLDSPFKRNFRYFLPRVFHSGKIPWFSWQKPYCHFQEADTTHGYQRPWHTNHCTCFAIVGFAFFLLGIFWFNFWLHFLHFIFFFLVIILVDDFISVSFFIDRYCHLQ